MTLSTSSSLSSTLPSRPLIPSRRPSTPRPGLHCPSRRPNQEPFSPTIYRFPSRPISLTSSSSSTPPAVTLLGQLDPNCLLQSGLARASSQTSPIRKPTRPLSVRSGRTNETKGNPTVPSPSEQLATMFNQLSNALKAEIKVVFLNDGVVDMLGGLNTGSSYSLPGNVIITVPSLPAGYEGKLRELRELKLVFESKSEYWDNDGRYTPSRIYTTSLDLATSEKPLLVPSSDPLHAHSRTVELAVRFDLRLPGWLPSSRSSTNAATEHGVVVHSSFGWTEGATLAYDPPRIGQRVIQTRSIKRSHNLLAHLAGVTEKCTSAYHAIAVRRHRLPSAMNERFSDHTERNYSLKPAADSTSPIECIVSVPDWVDCNGGEKDLKISIRVKARREAIKPLTGLAASKPTLPTTVDPATPESSDDVANEADPTRPPAATTDVIDPPASVPMERDTTAEVLTNILELSMDVDEIETFSSHPSPGFSALFPIPDNQPTRFSSVNALISPPAPQATPSQDIAANIDEKAHTASRRHKCLLADDGSQRNFVFSEDGLGMSERWRKVNVVLPMPKMKTSGACSRPTSDYDSPMMRVRHTLNIRVICRNVDQSGDDIIVCLNTPIRFGTSPKTVSDAQLGRPALPAYIQLFHENGDLRECDPLPLYPTPTPTCAPPTYTPPSAPVIPSLNVPSLAMWQSIGVGSSASSSASSSRASSVAEGMDLDTPASSDDGHSAVSSVGSSRVLPLPIPPVAGLGPRTLPRRKFASQPSVAASA